MKYIVGLTGGIGSGKSLVASYLEEKGINVVDADQIARDIVAPGSEMLDKVVNHFGNFVLQESGDLNRKALRHIIFNNPTEKSWLEQLLHPAIRKQLLSQLECISSPYGILVSPILFETKQDLLTNRTLVVDASENLQINRSMKRDDSSKEQIESIMRTQMSRRDRLKKADDVVDNTASKMALYRQLDRIHQSYLSYAAVNH